MAMDPRKKRDWVDALRSGRYRQALSRLSSDAETFCCLGVACDLARQEGVGHWIGYWHPAGDSMSFVGSGDASDVSWSQMPQSVAEWLGAAEGDPRVSTGNGARVPLSQLNDQGYSFNEIADFIEMDEDL